VELPYSIAGSIHKWPEVKPYKKTIYFVDHKMVEAQLKIFGKDNKPLYLLECFLNAFDKKDKDFDYTGDFECRLTPLFDDYYKHRTLFTDQNPQLRDWHSRGVFKIDEIQFKNVEGVYIQYPGYGRVRKFQLRGMNITLQVKNVEIQSESLSNNNSRRIKKLDLEVRIISDSTSRSDIAEPFKYEEKLQQTIKWPEIKPMRKIIHFSGHKLVAVEIGDDREVPLYLLQCLLNPNDDDSNSAFNFSGDFECRLSSFYDNRQSTLLTENLYPTRDWESRGRFLIEEITGKCADYPDYGKIRKFRLRGMNLTLKIIDLNLVINTDENGKKYEAIENLDLEVSIVSDSTAISEIAEPTKFVEPLFRDPKDPNKLIRDCNKILVK
jgi:hypothetical protein